MSWQRTEWPSMVTPTMDDVERLQAQLYAPRHYYATAVRWPSGDVDVDVWPDQGYRILTTYTTAPATSAATTARAAEALRALGWQVTGPWVPDGTGWRATVKRAESQ